MFYGVCSLKFTFTSTNLQIFIIMKTKLLFRIYTAIFVCGISFLSANAQVVTCYDQTESSANDFWLTHLYYL